MDSPAGRAHRLVRSDVVRMTSEILVWQRSPRACLTLNEMEAGTQRIELNILPSSVVLFFG